MRKRGNGEMGKWGNGEMAKCENGEMRKWENWENRQNGKIGKMGTRAKWKMENQYQNYRQRIRDWARALAPQTRPDRPLE